MSGMCISMEVVALPPTKAPRRQRPLFDIRGAAEYTGFSTRQFRRWIDERKLPIPLVRVNGRIYFDPDDLDRLVHSFPREIPASVDQLERAVHNAEVAQAKRKPGRKRGAA